MEIKRVYLAEADRAEGVVVVIDVIRAFTVAAYAFAGGADRLWLVRTTEEAFALREARPDALLAGEIGGRRIEGFDLNNSPARMQAADVRARLIIQRTGAGTQGAVSAVNATHLLVAALVNARATAGFAARLATREHLPITLLPTIGPPSPDAIEDDICADYIEMLLTESPDATSRLETELDRLRAGSRLEMFTAEESDFPADDIPAFMAVDRFDFAMAGHRKNLNGVQYVEVEPESSD